MKWKYSVIAFFFFFLEKQTPPKTPPWSIPIFWHRPFLTFAIIAVLFQAGWFSDALANQRKISLSLSLSLSLSSLSPVLCLYGPYHGLGLMWWTQWCNQLRGPDSSSTVHRNTPNHQTIQKAKTRKQEIMCTLVV